MLTVRSARFVKFGVRDLLYAHVWGQPPITFLYELIWNIWLANSHFFSPSNLLRARVIFCYCCTIDLVHSPRNIKMDKFYSEFWLCDGVRWSGKFVGCTLFMRVIIILHRQFTPRDFPQLFIKFTVLCRECFRPFLNIFAIDSHFQFRFLL